MAPIKDGSADDLAIIAGLKQVAEGTYELFDSNRVELRRYMLAEGIPFPALPLKWSDGNKEEKMEEWQEMFQDIPIDKARDCGNICRWAAAINRASSGGGTALKPSTDVGEAALRALELHGPVNVQQASAMSAAIKAIQKGAGRAQCTAQVVVWLVYFGIKPTEDCIVWYEQELATIMGNEGLDDEGGMCIIDVRKCTSDAVKQLNKNARAITLEVALTKREGQPSLFNDYIAARINDLYSAGLGVAAQRLQQVVSLPTNNLNMGPARARAYLLRVFYVTWLGRGMPMITCQPAVNYFANMPLSDPDAIVPAKAASTAASVYGANDLVAPGALAPPPDAGSAEFVTSITTAVVSAMMSMNGSFAGQGAPAPPAAPAIDVDAWGWCDFCKERHKNPKGCGARANASSARVKELKEKADKEAATKAAKVQASP